MRSVTAWSRRRKIAFRGLAILVGLAPLLLLEMLLRLGGWARTTDAEDPYVGFSDVQPLFVLSATRDRFEIPRSRQEFFRPESFAATKAPHEFRIFCLGGSTVQGNPYAVETSFTTWLELSLQAADSSRKWDVVNCGGISYASYRLVPILREVLTHQPDLIVLYTGHNEFLEDRSYQHLKRIPRPVRNMHVWLTHLRTYGLARFLWQRVAGRPETNAARKAAAPIQLPGEVDTLLDHPGGLERYHRDDEWRQAVIEHFELNLRLMIGLAREAGVPVILCNPVSSLKDCPPFKSQNGDQLSTADRASFDQLWREAQELQGTDIERKMDVLQQALAIDARHAAAHYLLAECYRAVRRLPEAREEYVRAKEEDLCPLRMLEPMHAVVAQVARDTGTPLVDVRERLESQSDGRITGEETLLDHVHPTISGHQQIAAEIFAAMLRDDLVRLPVDLSESWKEARQRLYEAHWATLDAPYFARGQERLEGLRRWAQGRGFRTPRPSP